jgi:type I restriction enzyme M protein
VVRNVPVCASGYNLKGVLTIINRIHFGSDDDIYTISQVYEDLLERMGAENRIAGEFYTPRSVIRFMVDVIAPQIGETVYDRACGSAGFLAAAYEFMQPQERTGDDRETLQHKTFFGQEKKGVSALLGTMNMVLHRVATPNITRTNTLEESVKGGVSGRFDVVLTHPPFGGTEGGHIQQNFPVKSNATELLFLEHIIKKLKHTPDARCGVVVPEGTLFRGDAFAEVKKDLLEQFHLFATLPPIPSGADNHAQTHYHTRNQTTGRRHRGPFQRRATAGPALGALCDQLPGRVSVPGTRSRRPVWADLPANLHR